MAVVGSAQLTGEVEGDFEAGKYNVTVYYRVVVDSRLDDPLIVCSASGLPSLFSVYEGNGSNEEMRLRKYSASRIGDKATLVWKVGAHYSTPEVKDGGQSGKGAGGGTGRETAGEFENPLLELPTVKMTSTGREKPLTAIRDNLTGVTKPCTASNGEVFDPPPRTLETVLQIQITRNEPISANHPAIALLYTDAVNSDRWFNCNAGTCKIKEILVERQERQIQGGSKVPFLRVTYTIECHPDGWDDRILDYGTYIWKQPASPANSPMRREKIKTVEGSETSAPLNGRGQVLFDRKPFTVVAATDVCTILADASGNTLSNGDMVQVSNIGGALPAPLREGVPYYVIGSTGLTFKLSVCSRDVRITNVQISATTFVQIDTSAPHGLSVAQVVSISGVQTVFGSFDSGGINGAYAVTFVLSPTSFVITATLDEDDLYIGGGSIGIAVDITTAGTGTSFIWSPGVFFTIRKFRSLPFAFLNLPQSFSDVQ